jgi:hypothetical protein
MPDHERREAMLFAFAPLSGQSARPKTNESFLLLFFKKEALSLNRDRPCKS